MRPLPTALSALLVAAAFSTASAQAPRPPQAPPAGKPQPGKPQAQPAMPPAAPVAPYRPVAITLPKPLADPAFEAFRKQLAEVAQRKDRAGLAKLVVASGFFWEGEKGDKAARNKSGIDNLSAAIRLGGKQGFGWEMLAGYASDPTAMPFPDRKDVVCAPADPGFSDQDFQTLFKSTKTEPDEWGYTVADGVEVRSGPQPNAPVIEKLGLHFVRVMPEDGPPPASQKPDPNQIPLIKVATPSGKTGFIPGDALAPLGNDQLCYLKDAGGWKITGFIGGDMP